VSAQPAHRRDAVEPIRWSEWIPAGEAARIIGVSKAHFLRDYCGKWAGDGRASKMVPRDGGTPQWFVHRSADPRFAHGVAEHADPDGADLSGYTEAQRAVAYARFRVVQRYQKERAIRREPVGQWLAEFAKRCQAEQAPALAERFGVKFKCSARSIQKWAAKCPGVGQIEKLIDTRGGDTRSQGDPAAWAFLRDCYLDARQPSLRDCWRRAKEYAEHHGLTWCTYTSCRNQLNKRIDPETQVYHRDLNAWKSKWAPYIAQDTERFAAGQCWVGDHRPLDVLVRITSRDGERIVRPHITAWQDWRTRRIVGWVMSEKPDSSTVLAALRMALLDPLNRNGPDQVWIDNGKDYAAFSFHGDTKQQRRAEGKVDLTEAEKWGVFQRLNVQAHFSLAFNPQGKARCERWFATLGLHFDKTFATYTGKDTVSKPANLQKVIRDGKHVPSWDHVRDRLAQFIAGYNANADHDIDDLRGPEGKLSPDDAMRQWNQTLRLAPPADVLGAMLLQHHKPVAVGRNGITLTISGAGLTFGQQQLHTELAPFRGGKRQVLCTYDPDDLRSIRVHDDQGRFVCRAAMNNLGPAHGDPLRIEHVKAAMQAKRRHERSLREARQTYQTEYLSTEELIASQAASEAEARRDGQPVRPDPANPMRLVRTPDEGASTDAQPDPEPPAKKVAGADPDEFQGLPSPTDFFRSLDAPAVEDDDWQPVEPVEFMDNLRALEGEP